MERPGVDQVKITETKDFSGMTVQFKTPMVADDETLPVKLIPDIPTAHKWLDDKTLQLAFLKAVPPGKHVTVLPASKQADANGRRLKPRPVEVFTPPLTVMELYEITRDDTYGLHFGIDFNGMVNSKNLTKHIGLKDISGKQVPFIVAEASAASHHNLLLGDSEMKRRKLFLTIRPGLTALGGEHAMPTAFAKELKLPESLTISLLKGRVYNDSIAIDFTLSSQASVSQLKKGVNISPETPFDIVRRWGGHYRIQGEFKPNSFYRVTFTKGLQARHGEVLADTESGTVVTPPLPSSVHFMTRGPVLPVSGNQTLPVRACNIQKLSITGWKIYPNNLQAFFKDGEYHPERYGVSVKGLEKDLDLQADQFHRLDVSVPNIIGDSSPGVYVFKTHVPDSWWRTQTRTVVLTDIGLTSHCSEGKIVVWARSFTSNQPLNHYLVQVISGRNQEIGRGLTDDSGMVSIKLDKGIQNAEKPYLIIASGHGDISVMKLAESTHGLAPFDISGHDHPALPYEAFMYTERGIYRPGESVLVSAILRNEKLKGASRVPAVITLLGPTGRVVHSEPVTGGQQGFYSLSMQLPAAARTGTYTIKMAMPGGGQTWGRTSFKVGAFMPDRIEADLNLDKPDARTGDEIQAISNCQYYFGVPAANCAGTLRAFLADKPYKSSRFPDFTFGDSHREKVSQTIVKKRFKTDEKGRNETVIPVPADLHPRGLLNLLVVSTVQDPGGRSVSATRTIPVNAYPFYPGLKKNETGTPSVSVQWVIDTCTPDYPAVEKLNYTLFNIFWERILVKGSNNYHFQWRKKSTEVNQGELLTGGEGSGILALGEIDEGHYELLIEDPEANAATRLSFWHDTGGSKVRPTTLNYLPLKTTSMPVEPDSEILLSFSAPGKGTVMVTGGVNEIDTSFSQACEQGENTLSIHVPDTALGSYYAGVTFVADDPDFHLIPRRLFGLLKIDISQTARQLKPRLSFSANAEPGTRLPITILLSQNGQPCGGYIHIFAVDEGILALTHFRTPAPFEFFHGERSCSLAFADLYAQLFPDLSEEGKVSRAGGGGRAHSQFLSPVAIDHLASSMVALPLIHVPESGLAEAKLNLPDFTGGMRIMAVAFNHSAAGSCDGMVTLRKRATVLISAPRAVAPGDQFDVTVQSMNHDVDAENATLSFYMNGKAFPESGPFTFPLPKENEHRLSIPLTAPEKRAGTMKLEARLTVGDVSDTTKAGVTSRPVATPSFDGRFFVLEAGKEKQIDFGNQWFPGTFSSTIEISTSPFQEIAPALAWLRAYPYGCLEQTASAAFPLPYYAALMSPYGDAEETEKKAVLNDVNRAVRRIAAMELPRGGFSTWPGNDSCWLSGSVYACHFLAEARESGASVDDSLWHRVLSFLRDGATGKRSMAMADRAYALCLLSRSGKPEVGVALGIVNDPETPAYARFLAAMSLVGTRYNKEGVARVNEWLKTSEYLGGDLTWGLDSPLRRKALAANMLMDYMPKHPAVFALINQIREEKGASGHWGTPQANSLATMAIGKFLAQYPPAVTSNGRVTTARGERIINREQPLTQKLTAPELLTIKAEGPGPLFVSTSTFGNRAGMDYQRVSRSLRITREYFDERMTPVKQIEKGDLVIVKVTVNSPVHHSNVVVVDLLPGGLEIEDSTLATKWAPKDRTRYLRVDSLEKLDDRLLLFCSLTGNTKHPSVFTYTARAVTTGTYIIPRAGVECMYKPAIRAATGSQGYLTIKPPAEER